MSSKKIIAVDPAILEAERTRLRQELADLRDDLRDAEQAVEDAAEVELGLQGRLHAGDDTVTADDMLTAQAEVARTQALAHGIRARIGSTERKVERTVVPKVAILVAEVLGSDELTGLIEWVAVADSRSAEARAILTEAELTGQRTGIVWQEKQVHSHGEYRTPVKMQVQADSLTRRLSNRELEGVLTASSRIGRVKLDAAQSGSSYRMHLSGVHEDATPTIATPKYTLPGLGDSATVREANIGTPTELEDGLREVEVFAQVSLTGGDTLDGVTAAIEHMGDPRNPAYTGAGVCIESKVLGSQMVTLAEDWTGRSVRAVVLDVRQVFRYQLAAT